MHPIFMVYSNPPSSTAHESTKRHGIGGLSAFLTLRKASSASWTCLVEAIVFLRKSLEVSASSSIR